MAMAYDAAILARNVILDTFYAMAESRDELPLTIVTARVADGDFTFGDLKAARAAMPDEPAFRSPNFPDGMPDATPLAYMATTRRSGLCTLGDLRALAGRVNVALAKGAA